MPMENKPTQTQNTVPTTGVVAKPLSTSSVMQSFSSPKHSVSGVKSLLILLLMVVLGMGAGYGASLITARTGTSILPQALNPNAPMKGKMYGNGDAAVFKDTAEGVVKGGGIEGEGQYHLVRPGGDSQNVYMTSSDIDLSQFIGEKIKVWGQTQKAQKAGWLMAVSYTHLTLPTIYSV